MFPRLRSVCAACVISQGALVSSRESSLVHQLSPLSELMRCPICTAQNPEEARFCNACGAPLGQASVERLQALRSFIPNNIAQKMMNAPGLGARRIVTVLFCDVVGSTVLGERLGPERFKIVMDQVLGRIVAAVSRYEGTIAQVMGDGLLTFFGAPLAHEDDAERAVRAALDIRDALTAYTRELETAYGVSLRIRVGLNTGPVVLSGVTDIVGIAYNALGDTVTMAARLQSAAAPHTIVASEATGRLVASLFETRPVGPLVLKGKETPVYGVEILGNRPLATKARGISGLESPLVGRDRELARLQDGVQAVTEGRGQIVAVIGEAGLGKSRLVAEVQRQNRAVRWLEGRCLSYAGTIPYFPFLDLFREWLQVTPTDPEMKVRIELRAALEGLFGNQTQVAYSYLGAMMRLPLEPEVAAQLADLSAESLQHETFNVMRQWVARLAAQQPLGLILDDMHWADGTSLALMESLLAVTEDAPVLLCLLLRPERDHGSWRVNDLAGQRFPHRHFEIVLEPLESTAAELLISNLLTLPDFPADVSGLILRKAEGNPFFIEEVIRELIEAGVLVQEGDRWRATRRATTLDIPDNIQGVLLSRIDRLPEEAKRALQAASVIGRLFPLDLLREVFGRNGRLDAALIDLQRHDLIVERRRIPRAEYRFKHALIQEAAYSTLVDAERRRLHRQLAQAMETQFAGRLDEVFGLLAYHYDQSAEEERALYFLVRAGDKARAEYADEEALRYYSRAVELMKQRGTWEAAAQTLMKAALAHHIAFDFRAANEAYREAFEILERSSPARRPALHPAMLRYTQLEPAGIDNFVVDDAPSASFAQELFEGLLQSAPEQSLEPAVARSWEISTDGTRYRFHLHHDRKWSDGRPVTAQDFVFTWLRGMRGIHAHMFHDIVGARQYHGGTNDDPRSVGVNAVDDYTLEVTLEGPRAYFPFILAHHATMPHPRWVIEKYGSEWSEVSHLVTNGPYRIAEWRSGQDARLVANPNYAGVRRGNVQEVRARFTNWTDPALFEQGEVDLQMWVTVDESVAARLRESLHFSPFGRVLYVFFRCDQPPFQDPRLRLAFASAVDREALASAHKIHSVPAEGGVVPPSIPGHSPRIGVPFSPQHAQQLLAAAGYGGGQGLGPLTMPILAGVEPTVLDRVVQMWKTVLGIQVKIASTPVSDYWEQLRRDPPVLGRAAWLADYPDPDNFLRAVFHSSSDINNPRWKNAQFDRLVEEAQASTDHRKRMAMYHEADRLLVAEDAAIIPLTYTRVVSLVPHRIRGWWFSLITHARVADLIVEHEI